MNLLQVLIVSQKGRSRRLPVPYKSGILAEKVDPLAAGNHLAQSSSKANLTMVGNINAYVVIVKIED